MLLPKISSIYQALEILHRGVLVVRGDGGSHSSTIKKMNVIKSMLSTVLCPQISFGGLPVSVKPSSGGRENFVGCMEGITYNGDNITNLVRRKKVDTSSFVSQLSLALCVYMLCKTRLTLFLSVYLVFKFEYYFIYRGITVIYVL